jgi:hypothetical protein
MATDAMAQAEIVEKALAAVGDDDASANALLDELSRARVWIPLPAGEPVTDGSAVSLPTVTYLGTRLVPCFTSARRLAQWAAGRGYILQRQRDGGITPHIVVPAAALARRLPPGLGIALNPGAETSLPIHPEGVAYLAATPDTGDDDAPGGASGTRASGTRASGTRASGASASGTGVTDAGASPGAGASSQETVPVQIGHPPTEPADLLREVRSGLSTLPSVREASRAWLCVPGQGEGLVISVTLEDPSATAAQASVLTAIENAVAAVSMATRAPVPYPVDATFPGETAPDQIDEWIAANTRPFYTRSADPLF